MEGNHTDATVKINNPIPIPLVSTRDLTSVEQLADVTSVGSGAIITAAERTAIGSNTTAIATKQNALTFGAVTDNNAVVLSQDIKSYGDANWAGGSSDVFLIGNNVSTSVDATFTGTIFYSKAEYYSQGGGQGTINLPTSPTNKQKFIIHSLNPDNGTGQIYVNIPANAAATWNSYTWNGVDDIAFYPNNQAKNLLLSNTGRTR